MKTAAAASPRLARVERWVPGVRVLRTYDRSWAPRDLIAGIVLVTLLVPQGMAYAELAGLPAITGLYTTVVCLVAYALVGPSPDPGPWPRLGTGPDDRRDDHPAGRRQRGDGNRARRDARAPRRGRDGRRGRTQAGVRRRPAVEPGADRIPGRPRGHHLHRPVAEAVRVLDGCQRPGGRGARVRPELGPDQPLGARDRAPEPGHHRGPQAAVAADARHPRRRRRRDRPLDRARPRVTRRLGDRDASPGLPAAHLPGRPGRGPAVAVRVGGRHLSRGHRRHDLDVRRVRRPCRVRGRRQPGAGRDRLGQPRGRPVQRLSRSARAARERPCPSNPGRRPS